MIETRVVTIAWTLGNKRQSWTKVIIKSIGVTEKLYSHLPLTWPNPSVCTQLSFWWHDYSARANKCFKIAMSSLRTLHVVNTIPHSTCCFFEVVMALFWLSKMPNMVYKPYQAFRVTACRLLILYTFNSACHFSWATLHMGYAHTLWLYYTPR